VKDEISEKSVNIHVNRKEKMDWLSHIIHHGDSKQAQNKAQNQKNFVSSENNPWAGSGGLCLLITY